MSHIEYTLAMTRFDFSLEGCHRAIALTLRDHLLAAKHEKSGPRICILTFKSITVSLEEIITGLDPDYVDTLKTALIGIGFSLSEVMLLDKKKEDPIHYSTLNAQVLGLYNDNSFQI